MKDVFSRVRQSAGKAMDRTRQGVKHFFSKEGGGAGIIAAVVLIVLVIVLGIAFRKQITNTFNNLWGEANRQSGEIGNEIEVNFGTGKGTGEGTGEGTDG